MPDLFESVEPEPGPLAHATFDSRCGECGALVFEGDLIYAVEGVWIGDECCPREERLG